MKQLFAGVALIFILGFGAFLYRNVVERPGSVVTVGECTNEAKICPDGSTVERSGPACVFAQCPAPNVENEKAGIAYAAPDGYDAAAGSSQFGTPIAAYVQETRSGQNSIRISEYQVTDETTADEILITNTVFDPSGDQAESLADFSLVTINGKTFYSARIERFEGYVRSVYFLKRETSVLRFDVADAGVSNWTDSSLNVADLPTHSALLTMLGTLQVK